MEIYFSHVKWYRENGYPLPTVEIIGDDLADWTRQKKVSHSVSFSEHTLTVFIKKDAERISLENLLRELPKPTSLEWKSKRGISNENIVITDYRWIDRRTASKFMLSVFDYTAELQ